MLHGSYGMMVYNNNSVKTMVCNPCGETTSEEESTGHLLFGDVECSECRLQLKTCQGYRERKDDICSSIQGSKHTFQFRKAVDSCDEKTSPNINTNKPHNLSSVLEKLSPHINNVDSLHNTVSWIAAIKDESDCDDTGTDSDEIYVDYAAINQESSVGPLVAKDGVGRSILKDQEEGDDFGDVLLLESYSLDHVEEMVEYHIAKNDSTDCIILEEVKCTKGGDAKLNRSFCLSETPDELKREPKIENGGFPEYWKKPIDGYNNDSKKCIKFEEKPSPNVGLFDFSAEVKSEPKEEAIYPHFLKTPSDGYYYMGHEAIEECPMCYAALCPSRFTVNARTFVLSTVCIDCNLPIYLMIDPYNLYQEAT